MWKIWLTVFLAAVACTSGNDDGVGFLRLTIQTARPTTHVAVVFVPINRETDRTAARAELVAQWSRSGLLERVRTHAPNRGVPVAKPVVSIS